LLFRKKGLVDHKLRYKRLRQLIRKVNKERKKQAKKIDILCSDIIASQRDFIKRLGTIGFAANFYESIVGTSNLDSLLYAASNLIKGEIADANVTFCLRQEQNFELHMFKNDDDGNGEQQRLENWFTAELVDNVCKANKICTLDSLFAMGLEGNLVGLNKISAATVPLGTVGPSLGFILIYRSSQNKLTGDEVSNITAVAPGLSQAIRTCGQLSHCGD